jgi:hypothetical protein
MDREQKPDNVEGIKQYSIHMSDKSKETSQALMSGSHLCNAKIDFKSQIIGFYK